MQITLALLSALVVQAIATPPGCQTNYDGLFEITIVDLPTSKRDVFQPHARDACGGDGVLVAGLSNGVLTDAVGRTGYIAANFQFQFDNPPQAGTLAANGFSVCDGGQLCLGDQDTFYKCMSGDFGNLYSKKWAAQCSPVKLVAMSCAKSGGAGGNTIGMMTTTVPVVTVIADGQPQVVTTTKNIPICQIGDGQVQAHTTPCEAAQPTASGTYAPPPPGTTVPPPKITSVSGPSSPTLSLVPSRNATNPAAPPATTTAVPSGASILSASPSYLALFVSLVGALYWF